jgi:hypothetical protein
MTRTGRGPRKWAFLLGALLVSACDAGVEVHFRVDAAADDSTVEQSTHIAAALAARHGLRARSRSDCRLANYEHSSARLLELCLEKEPQSVSVLLVEFIWGGDLHPDWSAKGDSLRRELEDTLRTQFGDRVTRIH